MLLASDRLALGPDRKRVLTSISVLIYDCDAIQVEILRAEARFLDLAGLPKQSREQGRGQ